MASTSASRGDGVSGRLRNAAATLCNDNQSLIVEARKVLTLMKEVGVDLERDNESQMVISLTTLILCFIACESSHLLHNLVKELEDAAIQLAETYGDCMLQSSAIESIGNSYQLGTELTDFKKLLMDEFAKRKATSSSIPEKDPLIRHFREAVWNVHHSGEPMPGEEQEDIIMTSTQSNLLNITCPLSGKPISELAEPVRSAECKHIYEKTAIMAYIKSKNTNARCPIAGCPRILRATKVVCDAFLMIEIEELKSMSKQTARTEVIEDFTALDDEEYNE
ncbi:hypothetical protein EZV62_008116 [Acer yangbiense]|uniref:SP-RING-type domain-containing protein n=1 Tax=Acer yangbiense TaxID=1000413 RepID=A0A5C7ICG7_9ROSI|nr:hypothetical protein EZV62_008116 [Acer yangbiense]